jgi:hypothetical protein
MTEPVSVRRSVQQELDELTEQWRRHALAAQALTLAGTLDEGVGARDMAAVSKELRACLAELRELAAGTIEETDPIDELQRRQTARVADSEIPQRAPRRSKQLGP